MVWVKLGLMPLNWRQPWCWPRRFQCVLFFMAIVAGGVLLSPWWLHSWQAWEDAQEAQSKLAAQQGNTQALFAQVAQWKTMHRQSAAPMFADASLLTHLANEQNLQLSQLGLDQPQHSLALDAMRLQQVPVNLKVQGVWEGWLNWLAQWPVAAPGVTVTALELKADPKGGISAQVLALMPQATDAESAFELSSVNLEQSASADPFSAQAWAKAQRAHAEQHPSYARLVAPELLRPREVLETFPRERLRYVGQIASSGEVQALVKVLPPSNAAQDITMMTVHRVRVGSHLGQDFGKVLAVQSDQLVVEELALHPSGEWQTREVRLPLHEALP